jgi:hypothetical protein
LIQLVLVDVLVECADVAIGHRLRAARLECRLRLLSTGFSHEASEGGRSILMGFLSSLQDSNQDANHDTSFGAGVAGAAF